MALEAGMAVRLTDAADAVFKVKGGQCLVIAIIWALSYVASDTLAISLVFSITASLLVAAGVLLAPPSGCPTCPARVGVPSLAKAHFLHCLAIEIFLNWKGIYPAACLCVQCLRMELALSI
jgi:hypothetical protein